MYKKIGVLHAHHTNVSYIEDCFQRYLIELVHFVDPGMIIKKNKEKALEQLEWMASCQFDAIIITCTEYIALLEDIELQFDIPIIKIDEPLFELICDDDQPKVLLFTNPNTVEGTMKRLEKYAHRNQKKLNCRSVIIEDTFNLILKGRTEDYHKEILAFLYEAELSGSIFVAQLSMMNAAKLYQNKTAKIIGNPLDTLVRFTAQSLTLQRKSSS
ncbi:hypothetical protein ACTHQ4_16795 [Alkalicoccobacillus gibsonii]|uniref:hypothetical protein n=1 Tax=Alkalicoccobacillus gibsonii TaxID=79881 RepID=UPI003F7C282B